MMPKYTNKPVRYRLDGGAELESLANNFEVANGRYFGGGLLPAPAAEIDDGLFDVVVFGDLDFKTIRRHLPDLRGWTHLTLTGVTPRGARHCSTSTGSSSGTIRPGSHASRRRWI